MSVSGKYVMTTIYIMRDIKMLPTDKWEESRHEAKDLAQDYLNKEKTRASCIKYFESHFKISTSTANRWYNRIYDELVVPDIYNALEIKSYKETVESEIDKCMKKLKDLTIEEKVNVLTKITKLKKDLKKL